jgi:hypothetical protein
MFDIIAAVVRRKLTGRRFDSPDRLHIHHRLLDRGWTPWQVLCLIGAICLACGAAATAATIFRRDTLAWIAAVTLVVLMIRLRLFGYEEFALVKRAVIRGLKSVLAIPGRYVGALRGSGFGVQPKPAFDPPMNPVSPTETSALWELFLHNVRMWGIHQVELALPQDDRPRRIRWIDPASPSEVRCHWSLSVSLPNDSRAHCELRVSSEHPIIEEADLTALTSLLKTFGAHFAAHGQQLFGPLAVEEQPVATGSHADEQRKAA